MPLSASSTTTSTSSSQSLISLPVNSVTMDDWESEDFVPTLNFNPPNANSLDGKFSPPPAQTERAESVRSDASDSRKSASVAGDEAPFDGAVSQNRRLTGGEVTSCPGKPSAPLPLRPMTKWGPCLVAINYMSPPPYHRTIPDLEIHVDQCIV